MQSFINEAQKDRNDCAEISKMLFTRNEDLQKRFENLQGMLGQLRGKLKQYSVPVQFTAAQDALAEAVADVEHAQYYNADYVSDSKVTKSSATSPQNTQMMQEWLDQLIYNLESVSLEDGLKP